ncbi:hypothetical protein [Sutcliffiella deserti]|uniref:hypothetical protein n=1 Tax=Sutcliffiella deserti TaxID=2875501 RepID=UPI001CBE1CCE|nr:hypothetical protein [Sutcliffiella deserti]
MVETHWDIDEVKHLKKKQLIQSNLLMLLLFVLFAYFAENGNLFLFFGVHFVLLWIIVAITLYTLKTGKPIGTKTNRRVQEFDKNRMGEKRWKRKKITEIVVISVINSVLFTVLIIVVDFDNLTLDFPISAFPFIGAWVGLNLGEIIRMNKL